jgi:hypothetical protein
MVEDARTARRVLELLDKELLDEELLDEELLDEANTQLMESLDRVRTSCPDGEYEASRAGIAQVTGPLFFLGMQPIYIEHLALKPAATPRRSAAEWAELGRNRRDH